MKFDSMVVDPISPGQHEFLQSVHFMPENRACDKSPTVYWVPWTLDP